MALLIIHVCLELIGFSSHSRGDPLITNDVLYQMSYSGHGAVFSTATSIRKVLFYVIGTRHNCTIILDDLCFHDLNVQGVRRGFNLPNDQR
jgi:hypothetical protein